ncbi:hypothetical protein [Clostridium sp. OS1-26]|uniref:hypothetical protein n=1 Tax=Clostridium sp. OS1-26 TaxID=3070681 RepID=UPI0027DFCC20|nr:hypothetical protein [Clostridium sp. OS1-26]WML33191.1 hypothetical protein RCG18_17785 [Clostridium sp. OS1-26]
MSKNTKLLYCILGSAILALSANPVFECAKLGMFPSGYGGHLFGELIVIFTNIISLVGFILVIVFSIMLIIININFKDK